MSDIACQYTDVQYYSILPWFWTVVLEILSFFSHSGLPGTKVYDDRGRYRYALSQHARTQMEKPNYDVLRTDHKS
jgi:hypothetical protein